MRILLDESAPRRLKDLLADHDVQTAPERGWASIKNGALLRLAVDDGYDVFVTPDKDIPHQQNLAAFDIAVVVLRTGDNRMSAYEPVADAMREAVAKAERGEALVFTG